MVSRLLKTELYRFAHTAYGPVYLALYMGTVGALSWSCASLWQSWDKTQNRLEAYGLGMLSIGLAAVACSLLLGWFFTADFATGGVKNIATGTRARRSYALVLVVFSIAAAVATVALGVATTETMLRVCGAPLEQTSWREGLIWAGQTALYLTVCSLLVLCIMCATGSLTVAALVGGVLGTDGFAFYAAAAPTWLPKHVAACTPGSGMRCLLSGAAPDLPWTVSMLVLAALLGCALAVVLQHKDLA